MLKDIELDCIMKKYHVKIGTRDDVNYIAFSDKIYELGSFEYRKSGCMCALRHVWTHLAAIGLRSDDASLDE